MALYPLPGCSAASHSKAPFNMGNRPSFSQAPLSLEEKVGQLLMVHFNGEVANADARVLIQEIKVGGIIYYNWSNQLHSPAQVKTLSVGLQQLAAKNQTPIPLLIAVDQEGGIVTRLSNGFTIFPGNMALGRTGRPSLAKEAAFAMGEELKEVGVNMNLAPVVDVNVEPQNPVIGIRSFGDRPESVVDFGKEALDGYRQVQIITTLKHFPGHGDVRVDSHLDLPRVDKSIEELERVELLPFAKLASSADAIMTAHLLVPALDAEHCSTLSEKTLNYLKDTIGFRGVIISDSLVMEGVLKQCPSIDEVAIRALNAGCHILLLGGKQLIGGHTPLEMTVDDVKRIHFSIVNAVKSGLVSEKRLNQAVKKILHLKERYLNHEILDTPPKLNLEDHQKISNRIAAEALAVSELRSSRIKSLQEKNISIFSPQLLSDSIHQTSLVKVGKTTDPWFFNGLAPSSEEIEIAKQHAEKAEVLIVCSYNAWKNPSQQTLIHSLLNMNKPTILLVLRDPLDTSLFFTADLIIQTFSPTTVSIQAACDRLTDPTRA